MAIKQVLLAFTRDMRGRAPFFVLVAIMAAGCGRTEAEPAGFTLQRGKVERRFGCHIVLDKDFDKDAQYAAVRFACRVPSSAMTEERWWGDQPQPMVFTLDVGDCVLLEMDFFCVETIKPGESVSFRETYYTATDSGTVIKRHKRRR